MVNTHHHRFQTLTRAVPGGQDALLFGWLRTLYPIWARFGPEHMFVSAQVRLAELALSGCSLTSDHLYLFPNCAKLDDTIAAAAEVGLRFHPTRGAMSIGESAGGLPPDALVETEAAILNDCIRVIDTFHDPAPCSNCRLGSGIAPVRAMRNSGVNLGLGVDGSASNDAGDLILEARQAVLLQRVAGGADKMSAREAQWIATRGRGRGAGPPRLWPNQPRQAGRHRDLGCVSH